MTFFVLAVKLWNVVKSTITAFYRNIQSSRNLSNDYKALKRDKLIDLFIVIYF